MRRANLLWDLALAGAATVIACTFTISCNLNQRPDDKQAVYNALTAHELPSVMVEQDRDKGVIKLSGIVGSADRKDLAQQLAMQAAPGYGIDNQIQVQSGLMNPPSGRDDASRAAQ